MEMIGTANGMKEEKKTNKLVWRDKNKLSYSKKSNKNWVEKRADSESLKLIFCDWESIALNLTDFNANLIFDIIHNM